MHSRSGRIARAANRTRMGADARAAHKTGSVALAMRMLVIQALALHVVWAQNSGSGSTCVWSGPGCPASMSFLYPGTTRCFAKKWVAPRCDFGSTKDALHPACTVTCPAIDRSTFSAIACTKSRGDEKLAIDGNAGTYSWMTSSGTTGQQTGMANITGALF